MGADSNKAKLSYYILSIHIKLKYFFGIYYKILDMHSHVQNL